MNNWNSNYFKFKSLSLEVKWRSEFWLDEDDAWSGSPNQIWLWVCTYRPSRQNPDKIMHKDCQCWVSWDSLMKSEMYDFCMDEETMPTKQSEREIGPMKDRVCQYNWTIRCCDFSDPDQDGRCSSELSQYLREIVQYGSVKAFIQKHPCSWPASFLIIVTFFLIFSLPSWVSNSDLGSV